MLTHILILERNTKPVTGAGGIRMWSDFSHERQQSLP